MESWVILLLLLLLPLVGYLYLYVKRTFSFWSSRGIDGPKPSLLAFGNVQQIAGTPPPTIEVELNRKYGKVYGNYSGLQPTLTIADAELIKTILVKDFPSWVNRRKLNGYHEMNNNHQFNAEGNQWKRLRTITGKTFTSGKLRSMYAIMDRCIDRLIDELETVATSEGGLLNTKEVIAGFTIDVIASSNFATETKPDRRDKNNNLTHTKNPFVENAIELFTISNPLSVLSYLSMPRWFNDFIGVTLPIPAKPFEFFVDLTKEVLKQRKAGGHSGKSDLVQLLIESYAYDTEVADDGNYDHLTASAGVEETNETKSNGTSNGVNRPKSRLSDRDIIAQSVLFLIAGFETTQSTISNIFYELAINGDVQERLRSEINEAVDGLAVGSDAYNEVVMTKVPYLEAVIKETLRKYPPVVRLERRLVDEEYTLPTSAGPLKLTKGQLCEISTIAVHYCPDYYPQPEVFNPDRFMPENKHLLVPYTYLPFGQGPRNCVGMRFAYQEIKLCLAKVLSRISISRAPTTPEKPQFGAFSPVLFVKPFQVKVEKL